MQYAHEADTSCAVDPWRPATPHSAYADDREDTILRPFKIIPSLSWCLLLVRAFGVNVRQLSDGIHHYDENGLQDLQLEPPEIRHVHGEMITFVTAWLQDWKASRGSLVE